MYVCMYGGWTGGDLLADHSGQNRAREREGKRKGLKEGGKEKRVGGFRV